MAGQVDIDIVINWSFLYRGQGKQITNPGIYIKLFCHVITEDNQHNSFNISYHLQFLLMELHDNIVIFCSWCNMQ